MDPSDVDRCRQSYFTGQASKPAIIQTHLKKLFAGIFNVNFDEEERHIMTMNSIEGEVVPLKRKIRISAEVNKPWPSCMSWHLITTNPFLG